MTRLSPAARTWWKHTATYLAGGKGGAEIVTAVQQALRRADELGAGTLGRGMEMLAQEFLGTHGAPREDADAESRAPASPERSGGATR